MMKFREFELQSGDAIFTYDNSWLAKAIGWFSKSGVTYRDEISHVALFIGEIDGHGMIVEEDFKGPAIYKLNKYKSKKYIIHVARPKDLKPSEENTKILWDYAIAIAGEQRYAYKQLFAILTKKVLGLKHINDWDKKAMICSEFYVVTMKKLFNLKVSKRKAHETTPLDLYNDKGMIKIEKF